MSIRRCTLVPSIDLKWYMVNRFAPLAEPDTMTEPDTVTEPEVDLRLIKHLLDNLKKGQDAATEKVDALASTFAEAKLIATETRQLAAQAVQTSQGNTTMIEQLEKTVGLLRAQQQAGSASPADRPLVHKDSVMLLYTGPYKEKKTVETAHKAVEDHVGSEFPVLYSLRLKQTPRDQQSNQHRIIVKIPDMAVKDFFKAKSVLKSLGYLVMEDYTPAGRSFKLANDPLKRRLRDEGLFPFWRGGVLYVRPQGLATKGVPFEEYQAQQQQSQQQEQQQQQDDADMPSPAKQPADSPPSTPGPADPAAGQGEKRGPAEEPLTAEKNGKQGRLDATPSGAGASTSTGPAAGQGRQPGGGNGASTKGGPALPETYRRAMQAGTKGRGTGKATTGAA